MSEAIKQTLVEAILLEDLHMYRDIIIEPSANGQMKWTDQKTKTYGLGGTLSDCKCQINLYLNTRKMFGGHGEAAELEVWELHKDEAALIYNAISFYRWYHVETMEYTRVLHASSEVKQKFQWRTIALRALSSDRSYDITEPDHDDEDQYLVWKLTKHQAELIIESVSHYASHHIDHGLQKQKTTLLYKLYQDGQKRA